MTTTRTPNRQTPPHGTPARYQGPRRHDDWTPCRCTDCRTAVRRAEKIRDLRRRRGHNSFLSRHIVAAHLRTLLDNGWTGKMVADAAGINRKTVWNILNSDVTTVRHDTARAVLALTPTRRPDGTVPSVGTRRRVHALAAMGWPLSWIAEQAGLSFTGLRDLSAGRTKSVKGTYRDAIDALYRTHSMRPGPSQAARRTALGKGWVTAAAWDGAVIDDPSAEPELSPETSLNRDELAAIRRADVEHLDKFGVSPDEIAHRLGMAESTVKGIVKELRAGERRDRSKAAA
ncbi:hypothetical protein F2B00_03145 [Streptomyces parvus]|uniref:hypothetical protein n=1 Tax=Streptomyces parvus TaxID=66428 RepID=UPI00123AE42E|nr:hypothetical protein [Streptomyces parvus]KAA6203628.1 hypothetical protein F2B00_03145 [Streptomyces parvus]GGS41227.1 hypothetical protein GCM10010221_45010 [Streptomyces parvus]